MTLNRLVAQQLMTSVVFFVPAVPGCSAYEGIGFHLGNSGYGRLEIH